MFKLARQRVLHVWIALLAILFSAMAPALSQAMAAPGSAAPSMEICTMDGLKAMPPDAADTTDGPPAAHFLKHCSFCLSHSTPPALPPPGGFVIAGTSSVEPYPPLFYQAAHALFPWTAANPRAPPARV
jgi:hypothetical protein